jgi:hypothetical protein
MGWFSSFFSPITDLVEETVSNVGGLVEDTAGNVASVVNQVTESPLLPLVANYFVPGSAAYIAAAQTLDQGGSLEEAVKNGAIYAAANQISQNISGPTTPTPTPAVLDAQFIAADASQLAAQGLSQAAIEQNLVAAGVDSLVAADAAQLALQGIGQDQLSQLLTQSGGGGSGTLFTGPSVTNPQATAPTPTSGLSSSDISLLARGGGSGMVTIPTPSNRAGISSGTADFSPEYYQQIQQYYNAYMPEQPKDVATPLQQWYETKFVPDASVTAKLFGV